MCYVVVVGDVFESSMNCNNSSSMSDDGGGDDDIFGLVIECVRVSSLCLIGSCLGCTFIKEFNVLLLL